MATKRFEVIIAGDASPAQKAFGQLGQAVGNAAGQVDSGAGRMKGSFAGIAGKLAELGAKWSESGSMSGQFAGKLAELGARGFEFAGQIGQAAMQFAGHMASMATAAFRMAQDVGAKLFELGGEFHEAYANIRIGTGATGETLAGLKDEFRDVLANVPADMATASSAIADLNTRLGMTGDPLEKLSSQFLYLSKFTGTDLAQNVTDVTRVFGDWGVAAENTGKVTDQLFRAWQFSGVSLNTLSQQVVQFGAPLRELGFSFEETLAMVAKFNKEGVNTELVMGGLKQGLARIAKEGGDPAKVLRDLQKSIDETGLTAENKTKVFDVFGSRAGIDVGKALEEGRFRLDEFLAAIKDGPDTLIALGEETEGFGDKLTRLKNQALLALEPAATKVFDTLTDAIGAVTPYVEDLRAAFSEGGFGGALERLGEILGEAWPKIQAGFARFGAAAWAWIQDAVPPMLARLGDLVGQLGGWITGTGYPLLVTKLKEWGDAFVGWLREAFPKVIAGAQELLGQLGGWITQTGLPLLAEKAGQLADALIGWVSDSIPPLLENLAGFLGKLGEWLTSEALPLLLNKLGELQRAVWTWVANVDWGGVLGEISSRVVGLLSTVFGEWLPKLGGWLLTEALPYLLARIWDIASALVPFLVETLKNLVPNLWNFAWKIGEWLVTEAAPWLYTQLATWTVQFATWITDLAVSMPGRLWELANTIGGWMLTEAAPWLAEQSLKLGDALIDFLKDLPGKAVNAAKGLFDFIPDMLRTAINAVAGLWNQIRIPQIGPFGPWGPVPAIGPFGPWDLPDMPTFRAAGGPVAAGRPYIVGELGPELMVPNTAGTIIPNASLAGGPGNVTVVLQLDGRTIARETVQLARAEHAATRRRVG